MDTLAHGLWSGAAFGRQDRRTFSLAVLFGVLPDLLSFGPFFLSRLGHVLDQFLSGRLEPPDPATIPGYVHLAYSLTHSLLVFLAVFLAVAWVRRHRALSADRPSLLSVRLGYAAAPGREDSPFFWPMAGWGLHILCDIPTHTTAFFPTPFLWPFHTPFVNGFRWGQGWFMLANYLALSVALGFLAVRRRRGRGW